MKQGLGVLGLSALLSAGSLFAQVAPQWSEAVAFGVSPRVSDLRAPAPGTFTVPDMDQELNELNTEIIKPIVRTDGLPADPLLALGRAPVAPRIPGPALSFEGLSSQDNLNLTGGASTVMPPDTNGDVGPNHYVQMTNFAFRVFDKAGNPLTAPALLSSLWSTVGAPCAGRNDGDPIVLYDPLADRWLLSQFCVQFNPYPHELIAISQTGDPTGSYYVWDFVMPNYKFDDYPHFGVWPDAYYMTDNQFDPALFAGAGAFAFDRAAMLAGSPTAKYIYFDVYQIDPSSGGMLPTDFDGLVAPPAGLSQLMFEFRADEFGDPADALRAYQFVPNFANPGASTFAQLTQVNTAAFDARNPSGRNDVEQPVPPAVATDALDAIADRLMFRVAYRNLGSTGSPTNSYVMNWSVNASGVNPTTRALYTAAPRWTELRRTGGTITINDQGTHAPGVTGGTDLNRWMGSVAQDRLGDIAVGFSTSGLGATQFPSIVWAGRLAGDAPGTLAQGEATMFAGTGVQRDRITPSARDLPRWGDYSAMTVDPVNDCDFWFTTEYRDAANNGTTTFPPFLWNTRIGSFRFAGCANAQVGALNVTVTNCVGGAALAGATVSANTTFVRLTNGAGLAAFGALAPASYAVGASLAGFAPAATSATVTNGGTTPASLCLQPIATPRAASNALVSDSGCGSPQTPNNFIDPGETVTVSLCLNNPGAAATTSLVGTLQTGGGVAFVLPAAAQNYGAIPAGGGPVCRSFSFIADGACGGNLVATLQLQDGATNLGTQAFNFKFGSQTVTFAENFDAIALGTLPTGWSALNLMDYNNTNKFTAVNTSADSGAQSIFIDDLAPVANDTSDKLLDSPPLLAAAGATLTFRHRFIFEAGGFDGGVLEISIGGGPFRDIVAAGGSFTAGNYNGTIANYTGNAHPFPTRAAWVNTSTGSPAFFTTTVNLPAAAAGQNVVLRWRFGSDSTGGATGWWIDSISATNLFAGFQCCAACSIVPANDLVQANDANLCSAVVNFTPASFGTCGAITCAPPSGSAFPVGPTTVNCSSAQNGATDAFTVTVNDVQAPTVTAPDLTVPNDPGLCSAVVPLAPVAADNCAVTTLACVPPSGSTFPVGTTGINCTAGDAAGNTTSDPGSVTVNDTEAPTFNQCPPDFTVTVPPGTQSYPVDYPTPVISDNCPGATSSCVPASGDAFPVGLTTVSCDGTDAAGNPVNCSFDVTLVEGAVQEIPTLGRWGLALLALFLAGGGLLLVRRRSSRA